jgi:mannose-6-phosphate isomerase-like protein (cupin superfamily)
VLISESFVIAVGGFRARIPAGRSPACTHPGRPSARPHPHRSDDEASLVLEGRLGFQIDGEQRGVAAGESILVTRGTPLPLEPSAGVRATCL